jgi:hypothetical protein
MTRARQFGPSPFLTGPREPVGAASSRRARRSGQRGGTLIEFAFTFVITLILMFAMIDFARALYSYHFVNNAAREAARWASVRGQLCSSPATPCPAQQSDITAYVMTIVPQGIDPTGISVNYPGSTAPNNLPICGSVWNYPGCAIAVQVNYSFNYIFPVNFYNLAPVSFQAGTINMASTAQMTISR